MWSSPSVMAASNIEDGGRPRSRRPRVLLVEDSPTDAMMIREILSQEVDVHNELHIVEDGMQALEFLRREGAYGNAPRPDLILLDLQLPRKNGQEVLAEIKADENLRAIPVVVLSSSSAESDIAQAYRSFANSYVTKPLDYDDFAAAVRLIDRYWLGLATRAED